MSNQDDSAYEMALVGSDGLETDTTEVATTEENNAASQEDISIADISASLSKMKEEGKEDIKKAAELEKKKAIQRKKDAEKEKKKKIEEAKEAELENHVDPELKLALGNNQFTEDMLGMLLK